RASPALLLERGIHIPVLEDLFQIRPYAQVRDMIGDGRKTMRHTFRDDDNVARFYFSACVSHHCAAAGRAVQNCCYFAVWGGTPPVDDGTPHDQGRAARYHDVTLGRIVMEDARGTCCAGTLLAACRSGACRRRAASGSATAACHGPAVDDGDAKLILAHIDHSERIIRNRALGIKRVLQDSLDVFVAY